MRHHNPKWKTSLRSRASELPKFLPQRVTQVPKWVQGTPLGSRYKPQTCAVWAWASHCRPGTRPPQVHALAPASGSTLTSPRSPAPSSVRPLSHLLALGPPSPSAGKHFLSPGQVPHHHQDSPNASFPRESLGILTCHVFSLFVEVIIIHDAVFMFMLTLLLDWTQGGKRLPCISTLSTPTGCHLLGEAGS